MKAGVAQFAVWMTRRSPWVASSRRCPQNGSAPTARLGVVSRDKCQVRERVTFCRWLRIIDRSLRCIRTSQGSLSPYR